ncbi:ribosome recycling factor [Patescibacteria group bacterium]|nr:ribosome recycling factor [Patescibacteria group bacterium]MBU1034257.1 ribosome recycling factor [Patescibacteria group bacterium]MBU1630158.1 ribosome recycling factor [Patescibacteria group bacterium]MBU1908046.1 ribosome recycling factor [Patescibacteria group bacterium]
MANPVDLSKPEFEQVIERLDKELHNLRSGRANASMVEDLPVEAYNSTMALKSIASISSPDAKTIQIEAWDNNLVKDIEKAIISSNIGLNPNTAGTIIRLVMPPLTEENRKNMVKIVHQKAEQARIGVRKVRESVRESVAGDFEASRISEDEKFRLHDQLDKLVSDYNKKIETMADDKEKDVMTI